MRRLAVEPVSLGTSLHQNFYEDWMTEAAVCDGLDNVDEFASRLKDVLD